VVEFPVTPELGVTPENNLPLQLTDLVGREREISEVENLLAEYRLLTLTGPGGSGKTRLALAVAQKVVQDYEDGAWLVELIPLSDPELVPQAVATLLRASSSGELIYHTRTSATYDETYPEECFATEAAAQAAVYRAARDC